MIKSDFGHLTIKGNIPTIQAETEHILRQIRFLFAEKVGNENAVLMLQEIFDNSLLEDDERTSEIEKATKKLAEEIGEDKMDELRKLLEKWEGDKK